MRYTAVWRAYKLTKNINATQQLLQHTNPSQTVDYLRIPKEEFKVISANKYMGYHFMQAFEIPNISCYCVQFHSEFQYQEFITLMQNIEN